MPQPEILPISRSFAGHLATNVKVRADLAKAKTDNGIAALINRVVKPEKPIAATDVPHIKADLALMFGTGLAQLPAEGDVTLDVHGYGGHI